MRIALIVTGGLHPSGREQAVPSWLALFAALAKQHEVHAFALRHLPEPVTYELLGFTVHDLGRPAAPLGMTWRAQERALARAMAAHGPFDVIHGFWADPAGRLAARAGRRLGIPSVVTCDSGEFVSMNAIGYGSQRTARGRRAVAEACALATRVHVCTAFMATQAAAHGVTPIVIPLTSVSGSWPSPFGSRLQPFGSPLRLLQVASLSRVKNQRLLIDTMAVLATDLDVHLDLAGEDTLDGELQRHAAALGLTDRITFYGFVPHDRLPALYAAADVYVQTSLHEAAGVSVLEAAAAGVPVIGTRAGYIADWSPDRATAIDAPDPVLLARTIRALLADSARAGATAARAQAWTHAHDVDWSAAQFQKLYRSIRPD